MFEKLGASSGLKEENAELNSQVSTLTDDFFGI